MSESAPTADSPEVPNTHGYRWGLKKIRIRLFLPPAMKRYMESTIVAKVYGPVAVYPTVKMDSEGKGVEYVKDSHSVMALMCGMRLTWTRDECDAFKIAQYVATMFPLELSYRSADKVMAGLPKWVAAWIMECRKSGGTKGGYVPPPETTEDIRLLLEKYNNDRKRAK